VAPARLPDQLAEDDFNRPGSILFTSCRRTGLPSTQMGGRACKPHAPRGEAVGREAGVPLANRSPRRGGGLDGRVGDGRVGDVGQNKTARSLFGHGRIKFGAPSRIRTLGPLIKSQLLYQLS
jgi:hypothetical protein